jgi:hypothetical protein
MMDLSNQDASFITGCVARQAGIRLFKKDVVGLQLIHIGGGKNGFLGLGRIAIREIQTGYHEPGGDRCGPHDGMYGNSPR